MKTKFATILSISVLLFLGSCKKDNLYPEEIKKSFETNFGSSFELTAALPQNYDPNKTYKAIFLLDAEWLLPECKDAMAKKNLSADYILFGLSYVGNNNRIYDFTPTKTDEGTGKANELKEFIENKIFQEYIATEFPNIDTNRYSTIFIGHSLGGLFGSYLFVNNSPIFGKYLLISSTLTYDSEVIFGLEIANRNQSSNQISTLYFGTGSQEEHGFHTSLQHLLKVLNSHYPKVINKSEIFRNTEHVGVRKKALQNGLHYLITQ